MEEYISKVILVLITGIMMLNPVLGFADVVNIPNEVTLGIIKKNQPIEDIGKPLGSPKIIDTYSKTTRTYSQDFWALDTKAPGNIFDKIIWKVDKDKILGVYTNQRRIGRNVKAAGVKKLETDCNEQKQCMLFRHLIIIGPNTDFGVLGYEETIDHEITIFRDGRSYLKRNIDK